MFKNKYYNFIMIMVVIVLIFDISYYLGITRYVKIQGTKEKTKNSQTYEPMKDSTVSGNVENNNTSEASVVNENSKIVMTMVNSNTKWSIVTSEGKIPDELIGKNKNEIEELYKSKGYSLSSMTADKVVLEKAVEGYNYDNDKYVLGIYNGFMAIYKVDSTGKLLIEDKDRDISKIRRIKDLPQEFQETLLKGSRELQFDNWQVANDYMNGCVS